VTNDVALLNTTITCLQLQIGSSVRSPKCCLRPLDQSYKVEEFSKKI
jgi:hypothetical protein